MPEELAVLAIAHYRAHDKAEAEAIVKDLSQRDPQPLAALARWYAAVGDPTRDDRDRADGRAASGSMQPIKNDPAFDRLKASPRFRQLLPSGAGAQK